MFNLNQNLSYALNIKLYTKLTRKTTLIDLIFDCCLPNNRPADFLYVFFYKEERNNRKLMIILTINFNIPPPAI